MLRKKYFLLILIVVGALLSGCANDQYAIEKQYWYAKKQAEKVFKNPHTSPPKEMEEVVGKLNHFISKYPQNNLSIDADFTIARLYLVKEEYEKSRAHLKTSLDKHKKSPAISVEVLFLIGNSYEIEDKWSLALEQYKRIMREYPLTLRGLSVPIYIAQHYKVKYQPDRMLAAYQEAISHYKTLIQSSSDPKVTFRIYLLVAECYSATKDWQNAVNTLNTVITNYKDKIALEGVLLNLALIYKNELKDKVKAKEILGRIINEYPKSRLAQSAKNLLKELEEK